MPRTKDSDVWNYFKHNDNEDYTLCKICKTQLKRNRVFNLKKHLFTCHNIDLLNGSTSFSITNKQQTITKRRRRDYKLKINKKQLLRSVIGLVIEESMPFNILNSRNMRNILEPLCEGLRANDGEEIYLNAANCKKTLEIVATNIRTDISNELRKKMLSLKIDRATKTTYLVSAQFIAEGQLIESRVLGVLDTGSICSEELTNGILKVISKYNINLQQIISVTLDNGASIPEEESEANELAYGNDEYLRKIKVVEEFPIILLEGIEVSRYAAQTAQLCLLDVTKSYSQQLRMCRNLTKFIRNPSNGYRAIFEMNDWKLPQLDCPTRYGSTYYMLELLQPAKNIQIKIESMENFYVDDSLWQFIDTYCMLLSPLQKALKVFLTEELHIGNFYAQWLICQLCTKKIIQDSKQPLTKAMGDMILESFERRTKTLMTNKSFLACLYLDPRFQHTLTPNQKIEAQEYLKSLWDRTKQINPDGGINSPTPNNNESNMSFSDGADELLHEYLIQSFEAKVGCTATEVYTKIENLKLPFQRSDTNILAFWQEKCFTDPELCVLSNICFGIPATQVSSSFEPLTLRDVLRNNRNEIDLENILLVKLNSSYLDNALENLPLFQDREEEYQSDEYATGDFEESDSLHQSADLKDLF